MEAKALGRNLRISPLKLRRVVNQVRGRSVEEAFFVLKSLSDKAAKITFKVLTSALANFKQLSGEVRPDLSKLKIKKIYVNQARVLKRIMPRARGRADVIRRQSSHLYVMIEEVTSLEE